MPSTTPRSPVSSAPAMISSLLKKPEKGGIPAMARQPTSTPALASGSTWRSPPMRLRLCWSASAWMTTPTPRKSRALKKACVSRWNIELP